jgi:hypothetical protein
MQRVIPLTESIYPESFASAYGAQNPDHARRYPLVGELVKQPHQDVGLAIVALRPYQRGELVGNFMGEIRQDITQHSLQIEEGQHLLDPHFIGYLAHSCNPNLVLDMHGRRAFCIRDIAPGDALSMDYASTEDTLFHQFACHCGSPNCRLWVTGRNQMVNEEGQVYLRNHRLLQEHHHSANGAAAMVHGHGVVHQPPGA